MKRRTGGVRCSHVSVETGCAGWTALHLRLSSLQSHQQQACKSFPANLHRSKVVQVSVSQMHVVVLSGNAFLVGTAHMYFVWFHHQKRALSVGLQFVPTAIRQYNINTRVLRQGPLGLWQDAPSFVQHVADSQLHTVCLLACVLKYQMHCGEHFLCQAGWDDIAPWAGWHLREWHDIFLRRMMSWERDDLQRAGWHCYECQCIVQ